MEYYSPQPPEPEKKDRTLLNILFAGCGCLVLIGIISIFFFGRFFNNMRGPARAVNTQLKAINNGNYALAYTQFSRKFRTETSQQQFRQDLEPFATLLPYKDSNLSRISVDNGKAVVEGTLTARDGAIVPVNYQLIEEDGKWRIQSYQWTPPGNRQAI